MYSEQNAFFFFWMGYLFNMHTEIMHLDLSGGSPDKTMREINATTRRMIETFLYFQEKKTKNKPRKHFPVVLFRMTRRT